MDIRELVWPSKGKQLQWDDGNTALGCLVCPMTFITYLQYVNGRFMYLHVLASLGTLRMGYQQGRSVVGPSTRPTFHRFGRLD